MEAIWRLGRRHRIRLSAAERGSCNPTTRDIREAGRMPYGAKWVLERAVARLLRGSYRVKYILNRKLFVSPSVPKFVRPLKPYYL